MEEKEKYTILTCPHCGDTKQVFNCICFDPFIKEFWSDFYRNSPYMPIIFPVQKCNHCGKYYFIHKEQYVLADMHAQIDTLNYHELKEAVKELSGSEQSAWEIHSLNSLVIRAYNSEFMREDNGKTPTEEDRQLFLTAINNMLNLPNDEYPYELRGELLRESGRFEEAVEVLRNLPPDEDIPQYYVKPVLEHALNCDSRPLLIIKDNTPLFQ